MNKFVKTLLIVGIAFAGIATLCIIPVILFNGIMIKSELYMKNEILQKVFLYIMASSMMISHFIGTGFAISGIIAIIVSSIKYHKKKEKEESKSRVLTDEEIKLLAFIIWFQGKKQELLEVKRDNSYEYFELMDD